MKVINSSHGFKSNNDCSDCIYNNSDIIGKNYYMFTMNKINSASRNSIV